MANHIELIKQVSCKNPLNDIIHAYERQKTDPRLTLPPQFRDQYDFRIMDIRNVTMSLKILKFTVARVFIQANDSNRLTEVGWVVDETCRYCLSCCKDFNVMSRKHHCRACGDRVCGRCTLDAKVETLENLGAVKICLQCHRNRPPGSTVIPLKSTITLGESIISAAGIGSVASSMLVIPSLTTSLSSSSLDSRSRSPGPGPGIGTIASPPVSKISSPEKSITNPPSQPIRIEPVNRVGIRLKYLSEFIEKAGGRAALSGLNFHDVSEKFVKPMTLYHKSSFVDLLRINRDPNIAPANVFVSHSWNDPFLTVVEALEHQYTVIQQQIILWIDLFSINQHTIDTVSRPIEWYSQGLQPMIAQIGCTVLVMLSPDSPACFQRTWCLFELYSTIRNQTEKSPQSSKLGQSQAPKVEIALPSEVEEAFLTQIIDGHETFLNQLFATIHVKKSEASKSEEKELMLRLMEQQQYSLTGVNNLIIKELESVIVRRIDQRISRVTSSVKCTEELALLHLYYMSGVLHDNLSHYDLAEKQFLACMNHCKIITKQDSPDDVVYLAALARISNVLRKTGSKLDEASAYYEISYQKHLQKYGLNHSETLSVMSGYALVYEQQGKYEEALRLARDCWEHQSQLLGEYAPETLMTLNNLGFIYQKLHSYERAMKCHEIFYHQMQLKYTDLDPITITALMNLAMSYRLVGKMQKAEEYYHKIYQLKLQLYGEKHPETLLAISNLALFYYDSSNFLESNKWYQQVYPDFLRVFGENHPTTIVFLTNVGNLYNSCGEYPEAEKLFLLGYQKNQRLYGDNHSNTMMCVMYLATVYENMKRYLQAEKYYQLFYERKKVVYGEHHAETVEAREKLELFRERIRKGAASPGNVSPHSSSSRQLSRGLEEVDEKEGENGSNKI